MKEDTTASDFKAMLQDLAQYIIREREIESSLPILMFLYPHYVEVSPSFAWKNEQERRYKIAAANIIAVRSKPIAYGIISEVFMVHDEDDSGKGKPYGWISKDERKKDVIAVCYKEIADQSKFYALYDRESGQEIFKSNDRSDLIGSLFSIDERQDVADNFYTEMSEQLAAGYLRLQPYIRVIEK